MMPESQVGQIKIPRLLLLKYYDYEGMAYTIMDYGQ
jgi:hypothetical protein